MRGKVSLFFNDFSRMCELSDIYPKDSYLIFLKKLIQLSYFICRIIFFMIKYYHRITPKKCAFEGGHR